jgi:hypothetical protein
MHKNKLAEKIPTEFDLKILINNLNINKIQIALYIFAATNCPEIGELTHPSISKNKSSPTASTYSIPGPG